MRGLVLAATLIASRLFSIRFLFGGVLVALLTGCGVSDRSLDILMESKEASVGSWATLRSGNQLALRAAKNRTAILMAPAEGLVVESKVVGEVLDLTISNPRARARGEMREGGCAVPVSRDGYFITAAHCLEGKKAALIVFIMTEDGVPKVVKSDWRIVWKSADYKACDLAVIHAPLELSHAFALRSAGELAVDDSVAITGASGMGQGTAPRSSDAAGRIKFVSEPKGEVPGVIWRVVFHDAPMSPGDSGGPLIDRGGRLIGINSLSRIRPVRQLLKFDSPEGLGYIGESVAPDLDWLEGVIEADRRVN